MNTREVSLKQEKRVAKLLSGHVQCNSGATGFAKGDVITEDFLIECKTTMTEKKSYSIKKSELKKNEKEALQMRKRFSALAFDFGDEEDLYFVINQSTMCMLIDMYNKLEGEFK